MLDDYPTSTYFPVKLSYCFNKLPDFIFNFETFPVPSSLISSTPDFVSFETFKHLIYSICIVCSIIWWILMLLKLISDVRIQWATSILWHIPRCFLLYNEKCHVFIFYHFHFIYPFLLSHLPHLSRSNFDTFPASTLSTLTLSLFTMTHYVFSFSTLIYKCIRRNNRLKLNSNKRTSQDAIDIDYGLPE